MDKAGMDWPATLNKWDLVQSQISGASDYLREEREDGPSEPITLLTSAIVEPAGVIRYARECGRPDMLPAAFYRLSCLRRLYDAPDEDKVEACRRMLDGELSYRPHLLQVEDYEALHFGQTAIKAWVRAMAYRSKPDKVRCFEGPGPFGHTEGETCSSETWWQEKIEPQFLRILIHDPGDVLALVQSIIRDTPDGLCRSCRLGAQSRLRKSRQGRVLAVTPNFLPSGSLHWY